MKKILASILVFVFLVLGFMIVAPSSVSAACPLSYQQYPACATIDIDSLGFKIPSLGDILTFAIRAFFVIAGLSALFYLLLGAFGWVTSGGDKDSITAAREKIQAAVLGMILIVAVLAIIWTLEQVIFKRRICLGLSCPLTLPGLIETSSGATNCCACLSNDGKLCGSVTTNRDAVGCKNDKVDTFANEVCGK